jgi:NAD(P)-dependent dehydrogenase (short-subunit alcohol dehydrogenase family)
MQGAMKSLDKRVVVVSGGAGYLGRTFSRAIAAEGGIAIVADTQVDNAGRVAADIAREFPGGALAASLDITSADSIAALIALVDERYGRIDALVNNAYPRNRNYGRKLEEVTYQDFCENLDTHLGGYFLMSQKFALYFRQRGSGNIVNMSSIYGVMAPRFEVYEGTPMTMPVEYAAIKSAVVHLTRYFAKYFRRDGIRVNALCPGGVRDAQPESFLARYDAHSARKGMLAPQDLCGTLIYLLSDASLYMSGQNIVVDDTFSL